MCAPARIFDVCETLRPLDHKSLDHKPNLLIINHTIVRACEPRRPADAGRTPRRLDVPSGGCAAFVHPTL